MAKQNKIRNVIVHFPTEENEEEFQRRAAKATAEVLCKKYPLQMIDKIIERLERR